MTRKDETLVRVRRAQQERWPEREVTAFSLNTSEDDEAPEPRQEAVA